MRTGEHLGEGKVDDKRWRDTGNRKRVGVSYDDVTQLNEAEAIKLCVSHEPV